MSVNGQQGQESGKSTTAAESDPLATQSASSKDQMTSDKGSGSDKGSKPSKKQR